MKEKCLKTLNIASDGTDVTCDGILFQKLAPETGKARFPTVERLNGGTASWLEEADRSLCRDGTSVARVKHDDRYAVAPRKLSYLVNELSSLARARSTPAALTSSRLLFFSVHDVLKFLNIVNVWLKARNKDYNKPVGDWFAR